MATGYVHPQLHKEIVADLQSQIDKLTKDRFEALSRLAAVPPDLAAAGEEILEQRNEIDRLRLLVHNGDVDLNAAGEHARELAVKLLESVELETFWKRCAEQALRLWENSQDMRDELCKLIALCSTIEAVHELLDDELNA